MNKQLVPGMLKIAGMLAFIVLLFMLSMHFFSKNAPVVNTVALNKIEYAGKAALDTGEKHDTAIANRKPAEARIDSQLKVLRPKSKVQAKEIMVIATQLPPPEKDSVDSAVAVLVQTDSTEKARGDSVIKDNRDLGAKSRALSAVVPVLVVDDSVAHVGEAQADQKLHVAHVHEVELGCGVAALFALLLALLSNIVK